jgi:hypothetical protein
VWFKEELFQVLINGPSPAFALKTVSQGLLVVLVLAATPFVGRRFGWGYAVYQFALIVLIIGGTRDFIGSGRYLLSAFPTFALAGEWLAGHRRTAYAWFPLSAVLAVLLTGAFAQGVYLT